MAPKGQRGRVGPNSRLKKLWANFRSAITFYALVLISFVTQETEIPTGPINFESEFWGCHQTSEQPTFATSWNSLNEIYSKAVTFVSGLRREIFPIWGNLRSGDLICQNENSPWNPRWTFRPGKYSSLGHPPHSPQWRHKKAPLASFCLYVLP